MQEKGGVPVKSKQLWRILLALALLAALFLVPGLVLSGGACLQELAFAPLHAHWWEVPLQLLVVFVLSWVWLWTEGSAFQIALALLLWFCIGWALCLLLRPCNAKTSRL